MKDTLKIGHIITEPQQKDAIHMAVTPVILGDKRAFPGDHVGILSDGRVSANTTTIGVIDPFLKSSIREGDQVWLFLYPGSITALRHEWEHPAFKKDGSAVAPEDLEKTLAKQRIEAEAASAGLSYDDLMFAARDYRDHDEYLCQGSRWDGHDMNDAEQFWQDFKLVTGEELPKHLGGFFSCSC